MDAEVSPTDALRFRFQLNKQLPANITVYNPGTVPIAFKVKTTSPKKYVVRPSSGVVEAKQTATVQVLMQAQKEYPADLRDCKDKFLVQTCVMPAGEDVKIRVVLEGPPAPPSPVPEVNEVEDDAARASMQDNAVPAGAHAPAAPMRSVEEPAALIAQVKALRTELEKALSENERLRKQVRAEGGTSTAATSSLLALLPVLLVGLLAFLAGHFLKPLGAGQP